MDGNTLAMIKALGGSGSVEDLTTSGGAADAGKVLVVGNDGSISAESISGETVIDSTLAIAGAAADAKAAGDAITLVNESLQSKADSSTTYTKTEVDTALASVNTTYSLSMTNNVISLNGSDNSTSTVTLPVYDGGSGQSSSSSSSTSSLPDLSDVTIASATNGQVLRYNGTAWINTNTPWAEMTAVASENLFDKNDITTGGGLLPWNGTVMEYEGMFYSYIPCESGTYTFLTPSWFYSDNTGRIPIYNSSKEYIGEVTGITTESSIDNHSLVTITISSTEINAGCTYFGFTENVGFLDSLMVVKGTTYPSSYIAFGTMNMIEGLQILKSQIIDLDEINNPLYGKIASFNGDSICAGTGFTGGYASIIGQENNMIIDNIAVGGATITPQANIAHIISTSINNMRSDADYIILEGGVNDADMHVTLGSITNGYTDTLDTTTFAGAFENMLKSAIARYSGKKIGYIFIHKVSNNFDSRTTGSYYSIAKEACEKWGISYLDLNTVIPPFGFINALKTVYTSNGDGYHPNENGYKLYYVPKITAWMKTL